MARQPVRIVLVDGHQFMREIITRLLSEQGGRYEVVRECGDAATARAACEQLQPDLLVLDVNLPDQSGIDAVPALRKISPQTRILLCTAYASDDRLPDALRAGADGFVEKTNTWDGFVDAIDRVVAGEHYFRAVRGEGASQASLPSAATSARARAAALSSRETEVLKLIALGSTNKEIAQQLGISVGTIDTHRVNLMKKLRIRNVAGLVVFAIRAGVINIDQPHN